MQLKKITKVLEYAEIIVLKVNDNLFHAICIRFTPSEFLLVCRLSSGSACNIHGTNNCSTTQCNCKAEYKGGLCEKCDWREFWFGTEGSVDPINGYGVKCRKGTGHLKYAITEFLSNDTIIA